MPQFNVGRPQVHRGLRRRSSTMVRLIVESGGARVLKRINVILVRHYHHNRIRVASTAVRRLTYWMREK